MYPRDGGPENEMCVLSLQLGSSKQMSPRSSLTHLPEFQMVGMYDSTYAFSCSRPLSPCAPLRLPRLQGKHSVPDGHVGAGNNLRRANVDVAPASTLAERSALSQGISGSRGCQKISALFMEI